ncbi:MAG: hypothetical protein Q8P32_01145 [Candidatus Komeilibacteria bacterium]|nr:hypothetical protein [Candidatus Komeilibacteria bacterium]
MNKVFKSAAVLTFFFSFITPLLAAGLAVEPSKLEFKLTAGKTAQQKLTIENISVQEVIYQLYFDELNEYLIVDQPTLRLAPGAKGAVTVSAKSPKQGIFATNLSIVGQELDRRQFNLAFGAKVPITLEVAKTNTNYLLYWVVLGITLLLFLSVAVFIFGIFKKRPRHFWHHAAVNLLHRRSWWKKLFD